MRIDRSTTLPGGLRLRLRLPHGSDRAALAGLLAGLGLGADELAIGRVTRFEPHRRAALCATVFAPGGERLVGFGAIDRDAPAPDLLIADEREAPGVTAALEAALRGYAQRRSPAA